MTDAAIEPPAPAATTTSGRALAILAGAAAAWIGACAPAAPPADLSSPDRFEWAQEKFDAEDYGAAARGFQDFIIRDPLNALVDSAQFMLGESYLRDGQELLAAGEFTRLATTRPNSPLADDAQFAACRAYWRLSPKLPLDQEYTRQAIDQCNRLRDFFPNSPLVAEAAEIIRGANAKLAEKNYRIGRFYFDRGLYESANIYFEYALSQAPPTAELIPDVLLDMYRSYEEVGFESEASTVRERLLRDYPESSQAAELRREAEDDSGG